MLSKPMRGARPNRQHWSAKGLVGEWLFNEGCGAKAFDSSGNENHGTLLNMASPPTATSGWGAGRRGTGLRFDGSNDYVNCGYNSSLDITDAITIEAWVKQQTDNKGYVVAKNTADDSKRLYNIYLDGGEDIVYFLYYDGANKVVNWTYALDDNNWHHCVVTVNGTTAILYIDGVRQGNKTLTGAFQGDVNALLKIGRRDPSNFYFNGSIDGVKIYNRALSAEEIAWDYINEYARYQPRLTLAQLRYFIELGVITDPSISSLSVNRTMKSKTIDRTIESLTPERTFNLGV